ncbi:MAG: DUF6931 family protein [Endozoicomonas sp.]
MSILISDDIPTLLGLFDSDNIREMALLQPDVNHLLTELLKAQSYEPAVAFLAHTLQPQFAITWAYFCLVHAHIPWSDGESDIIAKARQWLTEPDENHRRQHETSLETTGVTSSAGWLGQAIFWSGGSITPEKAPAVSPQPFLLGHALSGAVQLAATADNGQRSHVLYPLFIRTGLRVVQGLPREKLLTICSESIS